MTDWVSATTIAASVALRRVMMLVTPNTLSRTVTATVTNELMAAQRVGARPSR